MTWQISVRPSLPSVDPSVNLERHFINPVQLGWLIFYWIQIRGPHHNSFSFSFSFFVLVLVVVVVVGQSLKSKTSVTEGPILPWFQRLQTKNKDVGQTKVHKLIQDEVLSPSKSMLRYHSMYYDQSKIILTIGHFIIVVVVVLVALMPTIAQMRI